MPTTPLEAVAPLLDLAPDLLLVLSLDPRDGQPADITFACARLHSLRAQCMDFSPLLAFDGGVTLDSIDEIAAARPDMIVSGSAVMKSDTPETVFHTMRSAWQRSQT
jgi:ribulose-phosphate 3-epimerase